VIKNPTSLSRNGVSKSPYHTFTPRKGIGERISEGMIAEWGGLSTGKKKSPRNNPRAFAYSSRGRRRKVVE
jgi:hypothetical protein